MPLVEEGAPATVSKPGWSTSMLDHRRLSLSKPRRSTAPVTPGGPGSAAGSPGFDKLNRRLRGLAGLLKNCFNYFPEPPPNKGKPHQDCQCSMLQFTHDPPRSRADAAPDRSPGRDPLGSPPPRRADGHRRRDRGPQVHPGRPRTRRGPRARGHRCGQAAGVGLHPGLPHRSRRRPQDLWPRDRAVGQSRRRADPGPGRRSDGRRVALHCQGPRHRPSDRHPPRRPTGARCRGAGDARLRQEPRRDRAQQGRPAPGRGRRPRRHRTPDREGARPRRTPSPTSTGTSPSATTEPAAPGSKAAAPRSTPPPSAPP